MANLDTQANPILLECHKVTKSYSGVVVLKDVDFSLKRAEIHALVGENGAGKSTLIKVITGVTPRDSGTIAFDGHDLPIEHTKAEALSLGIGVIYQELSLIPGLTDRAEHLPDARAAAARRTDQLQEDECRLRRRSSTSTTSP